MGVTEIATVDEFNSKVLKAAEGTLVVVDYFATWCGPCKMISPKLEAMSNEFPEVLFFKVDVDKAADVSEQEGIEAMPTFLFFKKGQRVADVVGADESKIRECIKKHK